MEFMAEEICTPSHTHPTLCMPLVTSASGLVFDLAVSTHLFIEGCFQITCEPCESPEAVSLHALGAQVWAASPPRRAERQQNPQSRQHTGHELGGLNWESQPGVI